MYLFGHIFGWLWLMVTVTLGLSRHSIKAANRYLILRTCLESFQEYSQEG